ncbi:MAG: hypothetical protein O6940_08040 [Ignavibacteria bacterium]|nr:hypothetical protein [Ignavibacteria bacterium]
MEKPKELTTSKYMKKEIKHGIDVSKQILGKEENYTREISMYVVQLIRSPEINDTFVSLVKEIDRYELMVGLDSTEEELEKQSLVVTAGIVTMNRILIDGVVAK